MAIGHNDTEYRTSETPLAAYLMSEGFILLDVEHNDRSVFIFKNDTPKLQETVRLYQSGQAKGNIAVFFNAYKRLLRRIKEGF